MDVLPKRVRAPVKREWAEHYVLLSLEAFGLTVIVTRIFLEMTGYPQIGGDQLHVAHVLWGGLLLFVATLFPIVLSNQWALKVCAILSGMGMGLFIDEVGKFITRNNDYFYPPAAPIIYAFFLLTVLLYLQVRRPPHQGPRGQMYRALEGFREVLDHDLEPHERVALEARLSEVIEQATESEMTELATHLRDFLKTDAAVVTAPSFWDRWQERLKTFATRLIGRRRLKVALIVALALVGLSAVIELLAFLVIALQPASALETLITVYMTPAEVQSIDNVLWLVIRLALEGAVGALLLSSAGLLIIGKERQGIAIAVLGLLLSLTAVNLLVFYLDQFEAIASTLIQFVLLLAALRYRLWYMRGDRLSVFSNNG